MTDAPRFEITEVDRRLGILDITGKKFAEFHGREPRFLKWRLERCVDRLNSGEDTTTGYVWEKYPPSQVGTVDTTTEENA